MTQSLTDDILEAMWIVLSNEWTVYNLTWFYVNYAKI